MKTNIIPIPLTIHRGDPTSIMGIVNVTPDSFHDGGRYLNASKAVEHGLRLAEEGSAFLDVGGESTRPGSCSVTVEEEKARILPVISELSEKSSVPISVDTTKAEVAEAAIRAGASIINDVSAGVFDPEILSVAAHWETPYIAMHIRGTPESMQKNTRYENLLESLLAYFEQRIEACLHAGIPLEKIILDPGIGFGKSLEGNYSLLAHLEAFYTFNRPLLVGPSRKSFLKLAGAKETADRLPGTIAAVTLCALAGVEIIRVHDVAEAVQAVKVVQLVQHQRRQLKHDT